MIKYMWKIACAGVLFLGVWLGSCKNEDFNNGRYLFDPHTRAVMIDTVTIHVSNLVSADSVVTSNRGVGFSGTYSDPQAGAVQTQTYMEFNKTSDNESDKYAMFDSITLALRPTGNYYGDTVQRHASFKVYRLVNKIEKRDDGNLYSTSSMPAGEQIADERVKLNVAKKKDFEVRLSDGFGKWLFQGMLTNDEAFNTDEYLKTFPGLSIAAGTGSNCVHGLAITDSTCMLRIYYHVTSTNREEKTMTFKVNQGNSFYCMSNDKAKLPPYTTKSDPVPSSQTGNKGIIMASSTPMYVRLEFPHLNELLALGQLVKIQKATLYVRPIHNSYDTVPLPSKLNLYYFDPTSNIPLGGAIRPPSTGSSNNSAQDGSLRTKYENSGYAQYSFDVTDFVASQLGKVGYNKWALSVIIPDNERETTLQRLVFGNQDYWYKSDNQSMDNRIKIEITCVIYND